MLLLTAACHQPGGAGDPAAQAVNGRLRVYLNQREASGLYVRLRIMDEDGVELADSGFLPIREQPFSFSLSYPGNRIRPDIPYLLRVEVMESPHAEESLLAAEFPILGSDQPAVLDLVIKQTPEPQESQDDREIH
ncbi:hypothetical protein QVG61_06975 [Thiohalobacter sp. IOR34]|uniref:hypothetical protein n=1 Tax=Thiohalobacter sp. IOR34 TaxID=3057176 RepID=UPI0025B26823|nr:hypothetical protein [Thiohalobacter sp. IOR34]WJW74267.1 hypothetical protein QVG61_06975 [Thiohalobacter sp. IOR34]